MKKILPICASLLLSAGSVMAAPEGLKPEVFTNIAFSSISDNGIWVSGNLPDGYSTIVRNLSTKQEWISEAELIGDANSGYEPVESYDFGMGRAISNSGTAVGHKNGQAAYFENGQWILLKTVAGTPAGTESMAQSITPDGSMIVGYIGNVPLSTDAKESMSSPVVWMRQNDGTYGNPIVLPHPEKDITNRVPQYVTANMVSLDGRSVAGFMRDYLGMLQQPVLFYLDDKNEWNYKVLGDGLVNPNNVEFPEYPGEFDEAAPNYEDYFEPGQQRQWEAAHDAWAANGEQGEEPMPQDFMSPAKKEAYLAVYTPWYLKYVAWAREYEKFETSLMDCVASGVDFLQNNVTISPDGKMVGATRMITTVTPPTGNQLEPTIEIKYAVTVFDAETGAPTLYDAEESMMIMDIARDYSILSTVLDPDGIEQRQAYIYPEAAVKCMPLYEYMYELNEEMGEWMEDNMLQDVYYALGPNDTLLSKEVVCSGIPVATSDLSVILTRIIDTSLWVDENSAVAYSYVLPTGLEVTPAAVENIESAEAVMTIGPNATLQFTGEFASVAVYNLAGTMVFKAVNPQGTVATGLNGGIYIVKAVAASGNEIIRKVAL